MKAIVVISAIFAALLAGCASTTVQTEWRDASYAGTTPRSVMVLGVPLNSVIGNDCTDEFTRQLSEHGIAAIAGYRSVSGPQPTGKVIQKARELKQNGVLVCRFLQRERRLEVYPTGEPMMFGPELEMWPPYDYVENEYDIFRTTYYDTATGKPVWSAISDSYPGGAEKKVLHSYVKTMLKKMEKQGLIGKKIEKP